MASTLSAAATLGSCRSRDPSSPSGRIRSYIGRRSSTCFHGCSRCTGPIITLLVGVLISPLGGCTRIGYSLVDSDSPRIDGSPPSSEESGVGTETDAGGDWSDSGDGGLPEPPLADGDVDRGIDARGLDAGSAGDGGGDSEVGADGGTDGTDGGGDGAVDPCGDGVVDVNLGEECDEVSEWCVDCRLHAAPGSGWRLCRDASDRVFFFKVANAPDGSQWNHGEAQEHCLGAGKREVSLPSHPGADQVVAGLAMVPDDSILNCLQEELGVTGLKYWVGLRQEEGAEEPCGGWRWEAVRLSNDGDELFTSPFWAGLTRVCDDTAPGLAPGEPVSCMRIVDGSPLEVWDAGCDSPQSFAALCMVAYGL